MVPTRLRLWSLVAVCLLLWPVVAAAQAAAKPQRPLPWTLGPYTGGSFVSPVGTHWGITPDRRHLFIGLHATVPIIDRPRWSFRYAPELVPLLVVTNNPTYHRILDGDGVPITVQGSSKPVAGFGFSPIGLEGQARLTSAVRAYGAGALGGVWFTRQAPVLYSRAFNFTFEFGGGLLWRIGPSRTLRAGYKFHHFSNAKTAPRNPGVDAEVFLVGFEQTFGRR